jgi:hypothetical protein
MTIRFVASEGAPLTMSRLVYRASDYAFDAEPRPMDCDASVSINELELMISEEEQRVVFVSGYCPHTSWKAGNLGAPEFVDGSLLVVLERELVPGTSISLAPGARWPVQVDPASGWVCVGDAQRSHATRYLRFAPGCVAAMKEDHLIAVWLKPSELPVLNRLADSP